MVDKKLSHYFSLQRRYSRSINLERDLDSGEALEGYVLTKRAVDSLKRILNSFNTEEGNRAWTLTSVYGTGKSAFAHYLISLVASSQSQIHLKALSIAEEKLGRDSDIYQLIQDKIKPTGFIRAVATGQREPISHTIIKALLTGVNSFWTTPQRNQINVVRRLVDLEAEINDGGKVDSREIPNLVLELAQESQSGIFLVIDELGKNLEYAAHAKGDEDLYLLQQLAELPQDSKTPIYILGILHQAFAEYGQRLATIQRNEWAKIQGRFEDISFTESSGQMMSLIGEAIDSSAADNIKIATQIYAQEMKLADLVRRFKNLEALQKEVAAKGEGFEARRITMTRPDGQEIHQMVWVDHGRESQVEQIVDKILAELPNDQQLRQAILAKLSERILNPDLPEAVTKIQDKRSDENIKGKNFG